MLPIRPILSSVLAIGLLAGCTQGGAFFQPLQPDYKENVSTPADVIGVSKMFEMTQNWTDRDRAEFWHAQQGSLAVPFDLAMAVEQADSQALFMSAQNVARYRYVPQNAYDYGKGGYRGGDAYKGNPDGLPVGFAKSNTAWDGTEYLGMTCSACHSSLITYKGTGLFIDGAPTQADFQSFWADFTTAFRANLSGAKFDRLATRIGATDVAALRARLEAATVKMETREKLNETKSRYGYGRVDAVGQIYNSVSVENTGIQNNKKDPNAPVSFPHLWGTHQSDLVQWNGFAPNAPRDPNIRIAGPMIRNFGEVLGVFGELDIRPNDPNPKVTYRNSVRSAVLLNVEQWLERLAPPPWPADILGELDPEKVARGAPIYAKNCAKCHQVLDDPFQCYNAYMMSVDSVGTDPMQAKNSLRSGKTGPMDGRFAVLDIGDDPKKLGDEALNLDMLKHQIARALLHDVEDNKFSSLTRLIRQLRQERREEKCDVEPQSAPSKPEEFLRYKARPLNGIWATAPYLHNGSVPTLRALLDAPAERPATFTLGGWEYDPGPVGYAPYNGPNAFVFDTSKIGNSNSGHLWGTKLTDADKEALVEYLKSL